MIILSTYVMKTKGFRLFMQTDRMHEAVVRLFTVHVVNLLFKKPLSSILISLSDVKLPRASITFGRFDAKVSCKMSSSRSLIFMIDGIRFAT